MYVSAIVIFGSYYALMCIILNRLPPQISFLGGKYLYEKRENLAVNNLIKLILNHLYRQFCHCYFQKNTSLNIPCFFMFSQKIERFFFCNMNFDEIDKNCSGGNTYLLHTDKLFICPKILFRILKVMI